MPMRCEPLGFPAADRGGERDPQLSDRRPPGLCRAFGRRPVDRPLRRVPLRARAVARAVAPRPDVGPRAVDLLSNLALGFEIALSPWTLFLAVIGCFLGTIIGALPGLGPSNGVAILIPITFSMGLDATAALVLLTSVYYGAMYGGRISLDPPEHSRRRAGGDDDARRLSDGAAGPGRRRPRDLGRGQLRRRVSRHHRTDAGRAAPRPGRLSVRPGRIFRALSARLLAPSAASPRPTRPRRPSPRASASASR